MCTSDYKGCSILLCSLTVKIRSHDLSHDLSHNLEVLYEGETGTDLHFIKIILAAI